MSRSEIHGEMEDTNQSNHTECRTRIHPTVIGTFRLYNRSNGVK